MDKTSNYDLERWKVQILTQAIEDAIDERGSEPTEDDLAALLKARNRIEAAALELGLDAMGIIAEVWSQIEPADSGTDPGTGLEHLTNQELCDHVKGL